MSPTSKKYRELKIVSWTPNWVYRRYSSVKRKEFVASTGFPAEEKYAAQAYKKGAELFDEWLGVYLPSGRQLLVKDLARAVLAAKESKKGGKKGAAYRSARNQIENHLIPAFGHLRPDQVTSLKWETYDAQERGKPRKDKKGNPLPPRKALFNTRKLLVEIMNRALDEGLIRRIPDFKLNDPEAAPPKYLNRKQIRSFMRVASRNPKLLGLIMWKQGPRPTEACQYRFSMLDFEEGETGMIRIPGEITKNGKSRTIPLNSLVSRVLKWVQKRSTTDCIFPSPGDPERPIAEYKTGFERAFRLAGLEDYTPYNFRDTAINDMLKRGAPTIYVARYVQNSAAIIEKRYAVSEQQAMKAVAG